jgi:hypothetical protein
MLAAGKLSPESEAGMGNAENWSGYPTGFRKIPCLSFCSDKYITNDWILLPSLVDAW